MRGVLVDTNVIIDLVTENETWYQWSAFQIEKLSERHQLFINPIIYTELSIPFKRIEDLEAAIPKNYFVNLPLTNEVCFLAGKAFMNYKKNGGTRSMPLPNFFIGAQAAILGLKLVTRDSQRYQNYFPTIDLVYPN